MATETAYCFFYTPYARKDEALDSVVTCRHYEKPTVKVLMNGDTIPFKGHKCNFYKRVLSEVDTRIYLQRPIWCENDGVAMR